MSEPVKWGLIGASTIAREWVIGAIRAGGEGVVQAVCSTDAERGAAYAADNDIPSSTTRLADILEDPEIGAVYISTTNELHREQAIAAARAGKHILCEKPLALTLGEAKEMVAEAETAGVVFATNHHLRNAATHRALREAVQRGDVGTPLGVRIMHAVSLPERLRGWRVNAPRAGGGVVLDIAVHDADTARFVLDDEPVEAIAFTQSGGLAEQGLEDAAMGVLRFRSGTLVEFHEAYTAAHSETGFHVVGSKGTLVGSNCMTQRPVGEVVLHDDKGAHPFELHNEDLYARALRAFHAAIRGEGPPAATGHDGIRSLATALAVAESARSGRAVKVPE